MRLFLAVMLLIGLGSFGAIAQDEATPGIEEVKEFLSDRAGSDAEERIENTEALGSDGVLFPDLPIGFEADEETLATIQASVREYYAYRLRGFEHRSRTFEWQYLSSQIIFYVVIAIVLLGLYFSWMQFHAAKDGAVGETTFEASKESFKVSSPVLGVIILILSLAFFYLYLVHVYPISEIG